MIHLAQEREIHAVMMEIEYMEDKMAKSKLITLTQLKCELMKLSNDELISLVTDIAKNCTKAKEILTIKFVSAGSAEELLEQYKEKIKHEFFPKRGFGRPTISKAKKAITDFKVISQDKTLHIDIMLYYVENCVEFGADIDMNESFYSSAESVYAQVIKAVNGAGEAIYIKFVDRLKKVADSASHGWGFHDCMQEMYSNLKWVKEDE